MLNFKFLTLTRPSYVGPRDENSATLFCPLRASWPTRSARICSLFERMGRG